MTEITHFIGRKFSQSVPSGSQNFPNVAVPTPVEIGRIEVPRALEFRRLYFGFFTWQLPNPQIRIDLDFRLDGETRRTMDCVWEGGYEKESGFWYGGNLGSVTTPNPFFPAFEIFQRNSGSGNSWPYGLNSNPDSLVAALDYEDANVFVTTPHQILLQPFRMVGTFDSIVVSASIKCRAATGSWGGYLQTWIACASDEKRP